MVVDVSHGNSKTPQALSRPYMQTSKSVRNKMKIMNGSSHSVRTQLDNEAGGDIMKHLTDAPRNLKQVQNAKHNERERLRLSNDAVNNSIDLMYETEFVEFVSIRRGDLRILGYNQQFQRTSTNHRGYHF